MKVIQSVHDLITKTGPMRTQVYRPKSDGQFASIIFYSEIFQQTAPIARMATMLTGHGFVVLVPEIFHELNPIGTVLGYDEAGKNKGNQDKSIKPLEQHDSDTQALVDFALSQAYCSNKIGTIGVCIGGHLAYRAALNADVCAAFCLYPTDIHSGSLPSLAGNDSLSRTKDIHAELVMVFGKQDPHVSSEGRKIIYQALEAQGIDFTWQEVNAEHAFMRDEDERYDAALALQMYTHAVSLFNRVLK